MLSKREAMRQAARRILWGDREVLIPHVIEHTCPVGRAVEVMCEDAGWDYLSYLTAAVFNDESLITER